jgi:hypothetical protein
MRAILPHCAQACPTGPSLSGVACPFYIPPKMRVAKACSGLRGHMVGAAISEARPWEAPDRDYLAEAAISAHT